MPVFLVCEGTHGSLDLDILDALVIQLHAPAVRTEPGGGDEGLGAVRRYIERPQPPTQPDIAVVIQDRNYAPRATADAMWANPTKRKFMWRRHEIENYLLHPAVVLEMFQNFRATVTQPWVAQLPTTLADTEYLLRTVAAPLIENHAAEVLKYELIGATNAQRLKFSPPSVTPPQGRAVWLPALVAEATRVVAACGATSALAQFQQPAVEARYDTLLAQFQQPAFLNSGEYLFDMGGHELIAALAAHLRQLGASQMSDDFLASELSAALQRVYQPNFTFMPDDFAELGTILANL